MSADDIARGTTRLLVHLGYAAVSELTLANGRRADLAAVGRDGEIVIVEVKSGIEDYRRDFKWQDYLDYCDRFFFAVDRTFPRDLIPDEAGLIIADRFGADMLRDAAAFSLAGARRKAMLIRLAQVAAARLTALSDPELRQAPD